MAKYNEKLIKKITDLIEEGVYTISEICEILGISRKTFYSWRDSKPEFAKAIDEATELREEKLLAMARQSLRKKLEGYTLTETKYKYIPDEDDPTQLKLKEKIVKVKEYAPDNRAIKIVLDRHDADKTKNIGIQQQNKPLQITVLNENTKKQLEILQEKLQKKTG